MAIRSQHRPPPSRSRSGRAAVVLAALGGALVSAVVVAAFFVGRESASAGVAAAPVRPEGAEVAGLADGNAAPVRAGARSAVAGAPDPASTRPAERAAPRGAEVNLPRDGLGANAAELEARVNERAELVRKLMRGADERERLATAMEVLAADDMPGLKSRALDVLFELDPAAAEAHLLALLESEEPGADVRNAATIRTASRYPEALSMQTLETIFEAGGDEVRLASADVAARRGDPTLLERLDADLDRRLASESATDRESALLLLARRGPDVDTNRVVPHLTDDDEQVRLAALDALSRARNDDALRDVVRELQEDPSARVAERAGRLLSTLERRRSLRELAEERR